MNQSSIQRASVNCRSCGSGDAAWKGLLPDGVEFAGRALREPLPGGELYRCNFCSFVFRHPILESDSYNALYKNGRDDIWILPPTTREDFRLVVSYLDRTKGGGDVLDVGCYDGQLLSLLPKHWRLFGVELNQAAVKIAEKRGVQIVAGAISELAAVSKKFDVITACDVIEHVEDPVAFLSTLNEMLKPGGEIVITTGNADAWLWRIVGAKFWYCFYPEHISFIGTRWITAMQSRIGLQVVRLSTFNYLEQRLFSRKSLRTLFYALRYAYRHAKKKPLPVVGVSPPGCGATRDHMLCVLKRAGDKKRR